MSYTPTVWSTGDTITPAALNKLEQGVAEGGSGGGYLCVIDNSEGNIFWDSIVGTNIPEFESGATISSQISEELEQNILSGNPITFKFIFSSSDASNYGVNQWVCPVVCVKRQDNVYGESYNLYTLYVIFNSSDPNPSYWYGVSDMFTEIQLFMQAE